MVEAVGTTQSTFGLWAIVAVAMLCLTAWLISVYVGDSQRARMSRIRRRTDAADCHQAADSTADAPTRPDLPAQPGPAGNTEPTRRHTTPTGRHTTPSPRGGASDRAGRAQASPDAERRDGRDQR